MRLRILLIFLLVGTEDFSKVVKNVRGSLCDMSIIKFILGVVFLLILQSLDNRLAISGVVTYSHRLRSGLLGAGFVNAKRRASQNREVRLKAKL